MHYCNYCGLAFTDFSENGLRFQCHECSDFALCPVCYSTGVSIGRHVQTHRMYPYQPDANLSTDDGWTMDEELSFCDGMTIYGETNYPAISAHVKTRTMTECKQHRREYYVGDGCFSLERLRSLLHTTMSARQSGVCQPSSEMDIRRQNCERECKELLKSFMDLYWRPPPPPETSTLLGAAGGGGMPLGGMGGMTIGMNMGMNMGMGMGMNLGMTMSNNAPALPPPAGAAPGAPAPAGTAGTGNGLLFVPAQNLDTKVVYDTICKLMDANLEHESIFSQQIVDSYRPPTPTPMPPPLPASPLPARAAAAAAARAAESAEIEQHNAALTSAYEELRTKWLADARVLWRERAANAPAPARAGFQRNAELLTDEQAAQVLPPPPKPVLKPTGITRDMEEEKLARAKEEPVATASLDEINAAWGFFPDFMPFRGDFGSSEHANTAEHALTTASLRDPLVYVPLTVDEVAELRRAALGHVHAFRHASCGGTRPVPGIEGSAVHLGLHLHICTGPNAPPEYARSPLIAFIKANKLLKDVVSAVIGPQPPVTQRVYPPNCCLVASNIDAAAKTSALSGCDTPAVAALVVAAAEGYATHIFERLRRKHELLRLGAFDERLWRPSNTQNRGGDTPKGQVVKDLQAVQAAATRAATQPAPALAPATASCVGAEVAGLTQVVAGAVERAGRVLGEMAQVPEPEDEDEGEGRHESALYAAKYGYWDTLTSTGEVAFPTSIYKTPLIPAPALPPDVELGLLQTARSLPSAPYVRSYLWSHRVEHQIRADIALLQHWRDHGITSIADGLEYEKRRSERAAEVEAAAKDHNEPENISKELVTKYDLQSIVGAGRRVSPRRPRGRAANLAIGADAEFVSRNAASRVSRPPDISSLMSAQLPSLPGLPSLPIMHHGGGDPATIPASPLSSSTEFSDASSSISDI